MKKNSKNIIGDYVGIFLIVLLFTGVTETNDSKNYKIIYENLKLSPDWGYYIISKIMYFMNGNFEWVINFYYFTSIFFMYRFVKRYGVNFLFIIINLFIYTFFYHMNQIRYFLSFYLFLYSVINFNDRKNKKAFIYMVFSLLFHKAILFLFLYVFFMKLSLKKYIKILIFLSVTMGLLFKIIKSFILKSDYLMHYRIYFSEEKIPTTIGWLFSVTPWIITCAIMLLLHWFLTKKNKNLKKDKYYYELLKLGLFPIIFLIISREFLDIYQRYMFIFQIVYLVYFVYILKYFKKGSKKLIIILVVLLSLLSYSLVFELGVLLGKTTQKEGLLKIYRAHKCIGLLINPIN